MPRCVACPLLIPKALIASTQVCATINLLLLPMTEGFAPFYKLVSVGPLILISNACVAFLLNVAAVFLVGVGSGLVLTLAGVFKVRTSQELSSAPSLQRRTGHSPDHRLCSSIWLNSHSNTNSRLLNCISRPRTIQDFRREVDTTIEPSWIQVWRDSAEIDSFVIIGKGPAGRKLIWIHYHSPLIYAIRVHFLVLQRRR